MQDEEPVGTRFIASSNPAPDAKNDVPANADEHAAPDAKKDVPANADEHAAPDAKKDVPANADEHAVPDAINRVPTKLKFRNILARIVLVLLFAVGFFFSVVPVGRTAARAL